MAAPTAPRARARTPRDDDDHDDSPLKEEKEASLFPESSCAPFPASVPLSRFGYGLSPIGVLPKFVGGALLLQAGWSLIESQLVRTFARLPRVSASDGGIDSRLSFLKLE